MSAVGEEGAWIQDTDPDLLKGRGSAFTRAKSKWAHSQGLTRCDLYV